MVPGSTLRYGSNFCNATFRPRFSNSVPSEAAVSPLPKELTTPPVTKMYFTSYLRVTWLHGLHGYMGYMVTWLHGYMVAWLYGCMVAWLHGCVVAWLRGCMV